MSTADPPSAREARLAARLRDNLRRRKQQARARAVGAGEPEEGAASEPGSLPNCGEDG